MNSTKLRRKIQGFYGNRETSTFAFISTNFIIFIIFFCAFKGKFTLISLYYSLSSDIANISGILIGFMFTSLSLLLTLNNNMVNRLNATGNIKTVYAILFSCIFSFCIALCIYILKPILIPNIKLISTFCYAEEIFIKSIFLIGLFAFINGFLLFLTALMILKKILLA